LDAVAGIADEILLLTSFTDNTVKIAEAAGARLFFTHLKDILNKRIRYNPGLLSSYFFT